MQRVKNNSIRGGREIQINVIPYTSAYGRKIVAAMQCDTLSQIARI